MTAEVRAGTALPPGRRLSICGSIAAARTACPAGCFAYHASWRVFRRTGLKATPGWHRGFFQRVLSDHPFPAGKPLRVLICAASDEAMIAVIARLTGYADASFHMVDACSTPLALAASFAERQGVNLTVSRLRLPGLPASEARYDVIVSDGLLSLLPAPAQRDALLDELACHLVQGGVFLYTTRIAVSGRTLEYDRLGRLIRSVIVLFTWPGPAAERHRLAREALTRVSRPSPFRNPAELTHAVGQHFARVRLFTRSSAPSLPLLVHRLACGNRGSICVGVAATHPRTRGRNSSEEAA